MGTPERLSKGLSRKGRLRHSDPISTDPRQSKSVADRQHADIDTLVIVQLAIESAQRVGVGVLLLLIGDGAVPQHVVDGDETALPDELERRFVIVVVALL